MSSLFSSSSEAQRCVFIPCNQERHQCVSVDNFCQHVDVVLPESAWQHSPTIACMLQFAEGHSDAATLHDHDFGLIVRNTNHWRKHVVPFFHACLLAQGDPLWTEEDDARISTDNLHCYMYSLHAIAVFLRMSIMERICLKAAEWTLPLMSIIEDHDTTTCALYWYNLIRFGTHAEFDGATLDHFWHLPGSYEEHTILRANTTKLIAMLDVLRSLLDPELMLSTLMCARDMLASISAWEPRVGDADNLLLIDLQSVAKLPRLRADGSVDAPHSTQDNNMSTIPSPFAPSQDPTWWRTGMRGCRSESDNTHAQQQEECLPWLEVEPSPEHVSQLLRRTFSACIDPSRIPWYSNSNGANAGMMIAGGAPLRMMMRMPSAELRTKHRNVFVQDQGDIDLFVYGDTVDSRFKHMMQTIQAIHNMLEEQRIEHRFVMQRCPGAVVSVVAAHPVPSIQIILTPHETRHQVLRAFDVDYVRAAIVPHGNSSTTTTFAVLATADCIQAWRTRACRVMRNRMAPQRIYKLLSKGFAIVVSGVGGTFDDIFQELLGSTSSAFSVAESVEKSRLARLKKQSVAVAADIQVSEAQITSADDGDNMITDDNESQSWPGWTVFDTLKFMNEMYRDSLAVRKSVHSGFRFSAGEHHPMHLDHMISMLFADGSGNSRVKVFSHPTAYMISSLREMDGSQYASLLSETFAAWDSRRIIDWTKWTATGTDISQHVRSANHLTYHIGDGHTMLHRMTLESVQYDNQPILVRTPPMTVLRCVDVQHEQDHTIPDFVDEIFDDRHLRDCLEDTLQMVYTPKYRLVLDADDPMCSSFIDALQGVLLSLARQEANDVNVQVEWPLPQQAEPHRRTIHLSVSSITHYFDTPTDPAHWVGRQMRFILVIPGMTRSEDFNGAYTGQFSPSMIALRMEPA